MSIFHFSDRLDVLLNGSPVNAALIATQLSAGEVAAAQAQGLAVQTFGVPTLVTLDVGNYTHAELVSNVLVVPNKAKANAIHDAVDDAACTAAEHPSGLHAITANGRRAQRRFLTAGAAVRAAQQLARRGIAVAFVQVASPDGKAYAVRQAGATIQEYTDQAAATAAAAALGGGAVVASAAQDPSAVVVAP